MPIIIKDYTWNQTSDTITLQVPLGRINPTKLDLLVSPSYIKISQGQTYFEVILSKPIEKSSSKCTLTSNRVILELKKSVAEEWDTLEPNISREEKQELKKHLLEEYYCDTQKSYEEKSSKKAELKRVAVRKQIETDTEHRTAIETVKKHEESTALGDIKAWKKHMKHDKKPLVEKPQQPPLRTPKTLQIDFTLREFPTPSRESMLEEETEWLTKQAEARRSAGFIDEDIRPEERNPQFIKAKGDEFLRQKNYLGAISAYSFGIKLSKNFVDFYVARSEAHFAIGNFHKTLQDCSTALELMKPECPANLQARALSIGRRGEALCKLGMMKQGLDEIKYSLKLLPNDHYRSILEQEQNH